MNTNTVMESTSNNNNNKTISVEELANAFKESLNRLGKLDSIRASLRSDVFQCLQKSIQIKNEIDNDDKTETYNSSNDGDLALLVPEEVEICHGLIIEYLRSNGLIHTLSTFKAETEAIRRRRRGKNNDYFDIDDEDIMVRTLKKKLCINSFNRKHLSFNVDEIDTSQDDTTPQTKIPLLLQIIHSFIRKSSKGK